MSSNFSPNVYRTLGEALETFRWFDEAAEWDKHFEWWERYLVRNRLQEQEQTKFNDLRRGYTY